MKMVIIREATDDDKLLWNNFVSKLSDSPYHLYQWKEILQNVYGYKFCYLLAENSKRITGIFPLVIIESKLFGNRIISIPFADYGGPLIENRNRSSLILNSFSEYLSSYIYEVDFIELRSPTQPSVLSWLNENYECGQVHYLTFIINLSNPYEHIWKFTFNKNLRNAIRKAIKNNITIFEGTFDDNLGDFYKNYLISMKGLGSPPHSMNFFKTCYEIFGDQRMKIFLASTNKNQVIGGVITLLGKCGIFPAYSGVDTEFKQFNPLSLIFDRIIEWGCENKYRYFDFGRTLYDSGVYHFKKQWGGVEVNMPYYYIGKKISQEDPREKYKNLSLLWRKMVPIYISKKVGPFLKGAIGH